MSEEEKEAIEYIKAFQKDLYGASEKNLMAIYIDRVWNYIDKLQKENEELKDIHKEFLKLHQKLKAQDTLLSSENILKTIDKDYISKNKIREIKDILGEYEHHEISTIENEDIVYKCYKKLKELLEEN